MEYLQTLCFAGVNSKRRDFQQEKREKTTIAAVSVATDFLGRDKRLSKWLENCVATIFSVSQHRIATKDIMSRQEMGRSQLRQRSVMLRHNERL